MRAIAPKGKICGPIVARYVMKNKDLSHGAKLVYAVLCNLADAQDHCWPTQSFIAAEVACSVSGLKNYIAELVAAKLIAVRTGMWGHSSTYYILEHPDMFQGKKTSNSNDGEDSGSNGCNKASSSRRSMAPSSHAMTSQNLAALNNKNIKNTIYPLPPQNSQATTKPLVSPQPGRIAPCGGGVLSAANSAFDQVWNAWPIQQDRHRARRIWLRLFKAGELPKTDSLMAIIADLKANDSKWQRGYAPLLGNWLQGRRWLDLPTPATPAHSSDSSAQIAAAVDPQLLERTRAAYEALEARVQQPAPASPLPRQELWQKALDTYSLPEHQRDMAAGLWRYLHSKNSLPAELDMNATGFVEWLQACAAEACPHAPWAKTAGVAAP